MEHCLTPEALADIAAFRRNPDAFCNAMLRAQLTVFASAPPCRETEHRAARLARIVSQLPALRTVARSDAPLFASTVDLNALGSLIDARFAKVGDVLINGGFMQFASQPFLSDPISQPTKAVDVPTAAIVVTLDNPQDAKVLSPFVERPNDAIAIFRPGHLFTIEHIRDIDIDGRRFKELSLNDRGHASIWGLKTTAACHRPPLDRMLELESGVMLDLDALIDRLDAGSSTIAERIVLLPPEPSLEERLMAAVGDGAPDRMRWIGDSRNFSHCCAGGQITSKKGRNNLFLNHYDADRWTMQMNFRDKEERFFATRIVIYQYLQVAAANGFLGRLPTVIRGEAVTNEDTLSVLNATTPPVVSADFWHTPVGRFRQRVMQAFGLTPVSISQSHGVGALAFARDVAVTVRPMRNPLLASEQVGDNVMKMRHLKADIATRSR